MSIKDFRTKDEIIISINARNKSAVAPGERRAAGMLPGRITRRYLPRRKKPDGFIKLFDAAQKFVDNVWITTNVSILATVFLDFDEIGYNLPTAGQVNAIADEIVTDGGANPETIYREINRENLQQAFIVNINGDGFPSSFDSALDTENEVFTENGVKLTPEQLATPNLTFQQRHANVVEQFLEQGGCIYPLILNSTLTKVTDGYDFGADEVEFNLAPSDKIIFIPKLMTSRGISFNDYNQGGDAFRRTSYLNLIFRFKPRIFETPGLIQYAELIALVPTAGEIANFVAVRDVHTAISPSRTFHVDRYIDDTPDPTLETGGAFPDLPFNRSTPYEDLIYYKSDFEAQTGTLTGIIKRGTRKFYVWTV